MVGRARRQRRRHQRIERDQPLDLPGARVIHRKHMWLIARDQRPLRIASSGGAEDGQPGAVTRKCRAGGTPEAGGLLRRKALRRAEGGGRGRAGAALARVRTRDHRADDEAGQQQQRRQSRKQRREGPGAPLRFHLTPSPSHATSQQAALCRADTATLILRRQPAKSSQPMCRLVRLCGCA